MLHWHGLVQCYMQNLGSFRFQIDEYTQINVLKSGSNPKVWKTAKTHEGEDEVYVALWGVGAMSHKKIREFLCNIGRVDPK